MTPEHQKLAAHLISEIGDSMRDDDFQRDFFDSLTDQFERGGHLSEKQMESLNKIYERVTR